MAHVGSYITREGGGWYLMRLNASGPDARMNTAAGYQRIGPFETEAEAEAERMGIKVIPDECLMEMPPAGSMDIRDYFAAHAPEVPEWFMRFEGGPPCDPRVPQIWTQEQTDALHEHTNKRYFAWRWHYADEMMKARG